MKIAVFKTENIKWESGTHRTSDGYMYTYYVTSSISIYIDTNQIFKPIVKIINSFIQKYTSEYFEREIYKGENSQSIIGFSQELSDELAQLIMNGVIDINCVEGKKISLPTEAFYSYSESMGVVNDQESNYAEIKKKYHLDLENLRKEYYYTLIDATIDKVENPVLIAPFCQV